MKKTKMILPLLAFALALTVAFVSRHSQATPMLGTEYFYTQAGVCTVVPVGSCNNSPFGAICTFDDGSGVYAEVYDSRILVPPNTLTCQTVLRHSLNGGHLN